LEVQGEASIDSSTYSKGNGGELTINAENLKVINGGSIDNIAGQEATGRGGSLAIDVGNIFLSGIHSQITTKVLGGSKAGDLVITADKLEVRNGAQLLSSAGGLGNGGNMNVESNKIILTNDEAALSDFGPFKEEAPLILGTGIHADFFGEDGKTGNSGNVMIKSHDLIVSNGASITANDSVRGISGKLFVESNQILLTNDPYVGNNTTGISAVLRRGSAGVSGDLTVKANNLIVENGATINASNLGTGSTGDLVVDAESIILSGNRDRKTTGIFNEASGTSTGELGKLSVTADNLKIQNGASINTRTFGAADGGDMTIAVDNIDISSNADINASTKGSGNAGNITIKANKIALSGKGTEISSEALDRESRGLSSGSAGNIAITVSDMSVRDGASISTADFDVSSNADEGRSGNIDISLNDTLRIENKGRISTQTSKANAGNITINNGKFLWLSDSSIVTSVQNDKGNGGNIFISTPDTALDNSSLIAQAQKGQGGNITITGFLFKSPNSIVSASSELGIDGNLDLKPDTNISGSLAVLPDTFLNASHQMSERCTARSGNDLSSFVVKGRGGAPLSPGDLAPSNFLDYLEAKENSALESMTNPSSYSNLGNSVQFVYSNIDCGP
jgi:large exoprotein involved in heme utilization and adhesion